MQFGRAWVAVLGGVLAAIALAAGQWVEHVAFARFSEVEVGVATTSGLHTALVLAPAALAAGASYVLFVWAYPAAPGIRPIAKALPLGGLLFVLLLPAALRELPATWSLYPAWVVIAQCAAWGLGAIAISILFCISIANHPQLRPARTGAA